jgi:hypothetical protein
LVRHTVANNDRRDEEEHMGKRFLVVINVLAASLAFTPPAHEVGVADRAGSVNAGGTRTATTSVSCRSGHPNRSENETTAL